MVVNFEGSVINLRDKLSAVDKKKTQTEGSQKTESRKTPEKSFDTEKQFMADVVGIRNENRLAATSSNSIKTKEEAYDLVDELKNKFMENSEQAMNAHKKANPDAVMQFYPFE